MKNKNKNSITKRYFFRAYEIGAVKEMLEDMALKGWRLTELCGGAFHFEKAEPQKLTYLIEITKKKSTVYTEIPDEEGGMVTANKNLGWEYLCKNESLLIFISDKENAPSEETDSKQKLKKINQSMLRFFLGFWLFPLIVAQFWLRDMTLFHIFITSNGSLLIFALFCLIAVSILSEMILYYSWYFPSRFSLKKNGKLKALSLKYLKHISILHCILLATVCIFGFTAFWDLAFEYKFSSLFIIMCTLSVLIIIAFLVCILNIKKKFLKIITYIWLGVSIVVLFSFSVSPLNNIELPFFKDNVEIVNYNGEECKLRNDEIPLKREDFGIPNYKFRSTSKQSYSSVLAKYSRWTDDSSDDPSGFNLMRTEMSYSLFESKYEWLNEKYFCESYIKHNSFRFTNYYGDLTEIDSSAWGAKKVYKETDFPKKTIVVYDTKILEISENISMTDENIKKIKNKLGL